jgi:hypothetical protein
LLVLSTESDKDHKGQLYTREDNEGANFEHEIEVQDTTKTGQRRKIRQKRKIRQEI